MTRDDRHPALTPDILLRAYAAGIFPMAESADDPSLHWVEPKSRGVFPLDRFHVPKKLAKLVRADRFTVRTNTDFPAVIAACAAPAEGRENTWINGLIRDLYGDLFARGHCHTVEVYDGERLAGGLYGVSLGGAFFGESMFHTVRDASKVALVHLVARLIADGFVLLDAQFITEHLKQFGAEEIPRRIYQKRLEAALEVSAHFGQSSNVAVRSGAQALAILEDFSCRRAPGPAPRE